MSTLLSSTRDYRPIESREDPRMPSYQLEEIRELGGMLEVTRNRLSSFQASPPLHSVAALKTVLSCITRMNPLRDRTIFSNSSDDSTLGLLEKIFEHVELLSLNFEESAHLYKLRELDSLGAGLKQINTILDGIESSKQNGTKQDELFSLISAGEQAVQKSPFLQSLLREHVLEIVPGGLKLNIRAVYGGSIFFKAPFNENERRNILRHVAPYLTKESLSEVIKREKSESIKLRLMEFQVGIDERVFLKEKDPLRLQQFEVTENNWRLFNELSDTGLSSDKFSQISCLDMQLGLLDRLGDKTAIDILRTIRSETQFLGVKDAIDAILGRRAMILNRAKQRMIRTGKIDEDLFDGLNEAQKLEVLRARAKTLAEEDLAHFYLKLCDQSRAQLIWTTGDNLHVRALLRLRALETNKTIRTKLDPFINSKFYEADRKSSNPFWFLGLKNLVKKAWHSIRG